MLVLSRTGSKVTINLLLQENPRRPMMDFPFAPIAIDVQGVDSGFWVEGVVKLLPRLFGKDPQRLLGFLVLSDRQVHREEGEAGSYPSYRLPSLS